MTGIQGKNKGSGIKQKPSYLTVMMPADNGMGLVERIDHVAGLLKQECPRQFIKGDKSPEIRLVNYQKGEISYEIIEGGSRGKVC